MEMAVKSLAELTSRLVGEKYGFPHLVAVVPNVWVDDTPFSYTFVFGREPVEEEVLRRDVAKSYQRQKGLLELFHSACFGGAPMGDLCQRLAQELVELNELRTAVDRFLSIEIAALRSAVPVLTVQRGLPAQIVHRPEGNHLLAERDIRVQDDTFVSVRPNVFEFIFRATTATGERVYMNPRTDRVYLHVEAVGEFPRSDEETAARQWDAFVTEPVESVADMSQEDTASSSDAPWMQSGMATKLEEPQAPDRAWAARPAARAETPAAAVCNARTSRRPVLPSASCCWVSFSPSAFSERSTVGSPGPCAVQWERGPLPQGSHPTRLDNEPTCPEPQAVQGGPS